MATKVFLNIELSSEQASQLIYSMTKDDIEEYILWICYADSEPLKAVGVFRKIVTYFFSVQDTPHSTQSFSPEVSLSLAHYVDANICPTVYRHVDRCLTLNPDAGHLLYHPSDPLIIYVIRLIIHVIRLRTDPSNLTSKEDNAAHNQQDMDGLQKNPLMDKKLYNPGSSLRRGCTTHGSHTGHHGTLKPWTKVVIECGPMLVQRVWPILFPVMITRTEEWCTGSSLKPLSERPSDQTDKKDDRSYDQHNRDGVEENTVMDETLSLFNMFHMTITTSSAYEKAGRRVRLLPSLSPALPSKAPNPLFVMITIIPIKVGSFYRFNNNVDYKAHTGSTMEMLPLAIPESTGKEETASSQLPAPLSEASRPDDPANQETTRDSLADCVIRI
ncbi:hypothetical protein BU17DRAFT_92991 [Hysterangium stoloniferum]|nr:hypothetical protein BU17DRAFT_92991 [Hysterangium stoloniferum]